MLVRCRELACSNACRNQGGIAEYNPSLIEGRIFCLPLSRVSKDQQDYDIAV